MEALAPYLAKAAVHMKEVDQYGEQLLFWLNEDVAPKRITGDWPLAKLSTAAAITVAYLLFVFIGPLFAKLIGARDPYPMKFVYNLTQMALCSYMTIESLDLALRHGYSPVCNPGNMLAADGGAMANLMWLFYLSKVLDFFDTFFMILGHKWNQLTFLHVYHHSSIFMMYWANTNINYDGDIFLTVLLNGFIHAVMYTYYFLSMHTKDIWWKKYLTQMQMIQFSIMMTQATVLVFHCPINSGGRMTTVYFYYVGTIFALFAQFYIRSYLGGSKSKDSKSKSKKA